MDEQPSLGKEKFSWGEAILVVLALLGSAGISLLTLYLLLG